MNDIYDFRIQNLEVPTGSVRTGLIAATTIAAVAAHLLPQRERPSHPNPENSNDKVVDIIPASGSDTDTDPDDGSSSMADNDLTGLEREVANAKASVLALASENMLTAPKKGK